MRRITNIPRTWLKVFVLTASLNHLHADLMFARAVPQGLILKTLYGLSIKHCIEECEARRRCKQAIYKRADKGCSLTQEMDIGDRSVRMGAVLLTNFDDIRKADRSCGEDACAVKGRCSGDTGSLDCMITECGEVSSRFYTTYGNMYDIHSRLIVVYTAIWTGKRNHLTCGADGNWIGENPGSCCVEGCRSGVTIWPYNWTPYFCDMDPDGGKWVVFQRRMDGSENFTRGWNDYSVGFGNLNREFWLGLREMRTMLSLSTGKFELQIDLQNFNGLTRFADYKHFNIEGPLSKYRLASKEYTGTAGNSLIIHDGLMFSTYDNDNDIDRGNCALIYQGGWWFESCYRCFLNGQYSSKVHWWTWQGSSLKFTAMKFRKAH